MNAGALLGGNTWLRVAYSFSLFLQRSALWYNIPFSHFLISLVPCIMGTIQSHIVWEWIIIILAQAKTRGWRQDQNTKYPFAKN